MGVIMAGSVFFSGTANPKHAFHRLNAPVITKVQITDAMNASTLLQGISSKVQSQAIGIGVDNSSKIVTLDTRTATIEQNVSENNIKSRVKEAVDDVQTIKDIKSNSEEIKTLAEAIKGIVENLEVPATASPLVLSGASFVKLRKVFQLLNRLEDWILAEDWGGKFDQTEVDGLMTSAKKDMAADTTLKKHEAKIIRLLDGAAQKKYFLSEATTEERARYYLLLIGTRESVIRAASGN